VVGSKKKKEKKTWLLAYPAIDKDRLQHLQNTVTGQGFSKNSSQSERWA
jgi:hypothetical protein